MSFVFRARRLWPWALLPLCVWLSLAQRAAIAQTVSIIPNDPPAPTEEQTQAAAPKPRTSEEEDLDEMYKQRQKSAEFYQDLSLKMDKMPAPSVAVQKLVQSLKAVAAGTPNLPALPPSAIALARSPNRMTVLYASLSVFFVFFLLRSWQLAAARSWLGRLWARVWTTALFTMIEIAVVPWLAFGDTYIDLYREVFAAISKYHKGP